MANPPYAPPFSRISRCRYMDLNILLITDKAGASSWDRRTVSKVLATKETAEDVLHPSLGISSATLMSGGVNPSVDVMGPGADSSFFCMDVIAGEAEERAWSSPIKAILRLFFTKRVLPIS